MDDLDEAEMDRLSAKIEDLALGLKWILVPPMIFLSAVNFLTTRTIDRFAQIFADALPGAPLPALTNVLIHSTWYQSTLAVIWPALGLLGLYYGKRVWHWAPAASLAAFVITIQVILTWIGCLLPMVSI